MAPFMEHLWKSTYKKCKDNLNITFEEFFPSITIFSLLSRQEMLGFVFKAIDDDDDGYISKANLFRFLLQYRGELN